MNKIICGNNVDVMRRFENDIIDLTVTSPPYDGMRKYDGYCFDFEGMAEELYRITKPGGQLVWIVADSTKNYDESGTSFMQSRFFKSIGFKLNDTMIYMHNPMIGAYPRYMQEFDYMFVLCKGKPKTIHLLHDQRRLKIRHKNENSTRREGDGSHSKITLPSTNNMRCRGNVWHYNTGNNHTTRDKFAYAHPAMFPEELAADHIRSWSDEDDLVLDPFCGSGTVCKMAKLLNRRYIGIDISKRYCAIARKRVKSRI